MNNDNNNNDEGGGGGGGGGSTSTTLSSPPQDRISVLPVEILVRILGFLEMDELLIGTSLVSTKWRTLWKSVSTLKFSRCFCSRWMSSCGIRNNVEKYNNFVDHVLRLRDSEASKVQIFRYYYCEDFSSSRGGGNDGYLERLHNFIVSSVVNQGAQEVLCVVIYVERLLFDHSDIHFNPSIFNSGLLRVFNFDITDCSLAFRIHFPRSMCCATHLTHLSLNGIRLPKGDDSNDELHLVCPVLETLSMSYCYSEHLKVLDISAPKLNTLSICNIGMRKADFDGLGGCRIEIHTPNLTSLEYVGCVYVDCFTENLPYITDARLHFWKKPGMVEKTTSFAIKLLKGLTSAKSLTLSGFELFLEDILKELLTPFTSLKNLKLITSCKISNIHGMVHFLNCCSSVENLLWLGMEIRTVEIDEYLMLPQCSLSHLKHVHIEGLHGHKNEIDFVKFLLKISVVLEEIIILTTANSPKQSIEENLEQFIKEELSFRRSIKLEIL